jgi:hypothetical protein
MFENDNVGRVDRLFINVDDCEQRQMVKNVNDAIALTSPKIIADPRLFEQQFVKFTLPHNVGAVLSKQNAPA